MKLNNNGLLGELYYIIGKQTTNFRITHNYINKNNETCFTKWIYYLDATEEQIETASHRTLLNNEIVLDFDKLSKDESIYEVKKRFIKVVQDLKNNNIKFKAFFTGSNGFHVHIFYDKLFLLKPVERKEYRLAIINKYKCDKLKASDNCPIALESSAHWKTGCEMVEVCSNV